MPCTACGFGAADPHAFMRAIRDKRNNVWRDNEVADLKERLARAERERDEYQRQVHDLAELKQHMTSAASSAAATAVTAIEHLQQMDVVVKVAQRWRAAKYGDHPVPGGALVIVAQDRALVEALDNYDLIVRSRS